MSNAKPPGGSGKPPADNAKSPAAKPKPAADNPPPPADNVSLDDLEKMEDRLAALGDGLHNLRGGSTKVSTEQVSPAGGDKAAAPVAAQTVYIFGHETIELPLKEARAHFSGYNFTADQVQAGQLLAARLAGAPADTPAVTPQLNVLSLDEGQRMFAMYDGVAHWCGEKLWMAPLHEVAGVAAGETLTYDGSVAVRGSVADGATVQVAGSLLIAGNVAAATLTAGGDLVVQHAVAGAGKAQLSAGADLYVRYAEHATLEAGGSVLADEALLHCTVMAGDKILGIGLKTLLLGGALAAGDEIDAFDIGSVLGDKMHASAGTAATEQQLIGDRKKTAEQARERLAALEKEHAAASPEQKVAGLPELQHQQALVRELECRLQESADRLKENRSGRVGVGNTLQPGVTVTVGDAPPQEFNKELRRGSLIDRRGKIASEPYKEPIFRRCRRTRPIALATASVMPVRQLTHLRRMLRWRADKETTAIKLAAALLGLPAAELAAFPVPSGDGREKRKSASEPAGETEYCVVQVTPGDTLETIREAFFPSPKKSEIEVICESVEAGLIRAAAALKRPLAELQHRIVEEAKTGMLGMGAKPWRIAVSQKPKTVSKAFPFKTPALDAYIAACKGTFALAVADNELRLTVQAPKGAGKPVDLNEIKRQIVAQGFRQRLDAKLLEKTVAAAAGVPVCILKLAPAQAAPDPAAAAAAGEAAADAPAAEPRDGTGPRLYCWPWEREKEMSEKKMRQSLLYSDMSDIAVHAGQLLAARLSDDTGDATIFTPGENVLSADGGVRLFAAVDGLVRWQGDKVAVSPIRKIDGDVTAKIGNIVTPGSIIVTGDVEDGMTLQADDNIMVMGTVGKATLSAGGTITVKKGIRGGGQGTVRAGADIYAGFIENTTVEAEVNVVVDEAIMQCRVTAGKKIICIGEKGLIVGGTLQAGEEVNCRDLGTTAGVETIVIVGSRNADKAALEQLRQELSRTRTQCDTLRTQVNLLVTRKAAGQLAPGEQEQLDQQIAELKQLEPLLERLQAQEQRLVTAIESPVEGMINVAGTAYAGRKLTVDRSDPIVMHKEEKRVCYIEKKGVIGVTTYHEPKIKRQQDQPATGAATPQEIDFTEHAARLARLRKCQRLLAPDTTTAQKQAALFTGLDAETLVAFVIPDPAAAAGKKEKEKAAPAGPRAYLVVQILAGESPAALERKYLPGVKRTHADVTCDSIADGLKQGAAALGLPVDQVMHKVIQERSKGLFGVGAKPYILQISEKPKKERASPSAAAEAMAQLNQKEDGRFTLVNDDRGLLLTVHPPKGDGLRVEADKVKKELASRHYSSAIDMKIITDTVRAATGEEVIIAVRQPEPDLDGSIKLEISPDKMQCLATVFPAKPLGRATKMDDLLRQLSEAGIKRADQSLIQKIYSEGLYGKPLVVAQGVPAVPGQDGRYEFKVDITAKTAHLDADEHGKVNFKEMHLVSSVTAGQVIATVFPAVTGTPGIDIYEREVPVKPVKDQPLTIGRNAELSADGREVLATADGQVIQIGRTVRVEPVFYVGGDVNFETGNIHSLGSVVVKGTICPGFSVRAVGNITAGSVDKANLEAEGDISVLGGIIGDAATAIKAGQDIHAKFVEGARLRAGRDIVAQEIIMHSECSAGRAVVCQAGKKGTIVGGIIRAGAVVAAKDLGTAVATKTIIEVGLDPLVRQQVADLEKMLNEYAENFSKIRLGLKVLLELKQKAGALPPAKEQLLQQLQSAAASMQQRIARTEEQQAALQATMAAKSGGKISASQHVHPGCRLTIRNATLIIESAVQHTSFGYEAGEVRPLVYTEYVPKDNPAEE